MRRLRTTSGIEEGGFTLIEVVFTIALMSIAFIAILGAVTVLISSTAENQHGSTAESAVRNVGEYLKTVPYKRCDQSPKSSYQTAVDTAPSGTVPSGYAATITSVQAWNGDNPATFGADGGCANGEQGVELVTVQVSSSANGLGGQFTKTLTIIKWDAS